ncbi:MAG: lipoate--protein ligase [Candidatus Bathyarchaeota archaeon]|jgi:lipoate-protein ligase A
MWRLVDLGPVDGYTMTNLYEAVGQAVSNGAVPNTVILNHPAKPFVNIGFHQLMEKEIDVGYARGMEFDLVRRTIGGGAILDGPWEQDYFFVVDKKSAECPDTMEGFYRKFLGPPVLALNKLGFEASVRPPNDILVGGRKISGNGAITIEGANVLAGDLLLDAPSDLMSRIIQAPSEKFQDKLVESMGEWLTSIRGELGEGVSRGSVKAALIDASGESLGVELEPGNLTEREELCLSGLIEERRQEEWIFGKDLELQSLVSGPVATKVRGGVNVSEAVYKAGKLIRVTVVSEDGLIRGVSISGDFFTVPFMGAVSDLEDALVGVPLEEEALGEAVAEAFERLGLNVFGAEQGDIVAALLEAKV